MLNAFPLRIGYEPEPVYAVHKPHSKHEEVFQRIRFAREHELSR